MAPGAFTRLLGWVFVIIGVAGFFTGDMLLIFQVDPIHNVIHILTGVLAFLAVGMKLDVLFLKVFGVVYALVTVLGFVMNGDVLGIIQVNMADNILHAVVAAACLFVGFTAAGTQKQVGV